MKIEKKINIPRFPKDIEITKLLDLISDKSSNFMGLRCTRFAMIVDNNIISELFIEESGKLDVSSAENILSNL